MLPTLNAEVLLRQRLPHEIAFGPPFFTRKIAQHELGLRSFVKGRVHILEMVRTLRIGVPENTRPRRKTPQCCGLLARVGNFGSCAQSMGKTAAISGERQFGLRRSCQQPRLRARRPFVAVVDNSSVVARRTDSVLKV